MQYWLMKSEPIEFSIDDLQKVKKEGWDGIRNYQVRNMFRDDFTKGDRALFYHSNIADPAVVGTMQIASDAYPDPTQFDTSSNHYDAKSTKADPRWLLVDVVFAEKFIEPVTLEYLKSYKKYSDMQVTQKGNRLSVMPVSQHIYKSIVKLGRG